LENGTTSNTTLQVVNLATRLVDVKGADDNEARRRQEVSLRDWNLRANVLVDDLNVVA
jgi:hypothetical protein